MKVTICDNCGKQVKEYMVFNISYLKICDSTDSLSPEIKTPLLDYCEECFGKLLEKLNLEEK